MHLIATSDNSYGDDRLKYLPAEETISEVDREGALTLRFCRHRASASSSTQLQILLSLLAALLLFVVITDAQQETRPELPLVSRPAYNYGSGPIVAIDEAHKNTHTYGSREFQGFVKLVQADGCRVRPFTTAITGESLKGIDVLIISNPGGWQRPGDSLSDVEIYAMTRWIRAGGSLLFVLDHMPFPLNAEKVAAGLGITDWHNGYARVELPDSQSVGNIIFWRADFFPGGEPTIAATGPGGGTGYQGADAVLARHRITEGRDSTELVRRVATFVGSAFKVSSGYEKLLTLPRRASSFTPPPTPDAIPPITKDTPRTPVEGWQQGAVRNMGKGRLAVFGETGLFSGGPAADNRQFVLNVMRWLTRVL